MNKYKRYKKVNDTQFYRGTAVVKTPDGKVAPISGNWLLEYFPFAGIVSSTTKNTANVQIYGNAKVTLK